MKPDESTRELLLGYLLDALDAEESEYVEKMLVAEPAWREELSRLRSCVNPLSDDPPADHEPPRHLAIKTCRFVAWRSEVVLSPASRSETSDQSRASRWSLADVAVAAGVFFAASLLFFPAINQSRQFAQLQACQNNVKEIVHAAHRYSQTHHGLLPEVPQSGPLGVAGVFPAQLLQAGYLASPRVLRCPGAPASSSSVEICSRPLDELKQAPPSVVIRFQREMGGDYAYLIGYFKRGEYCCHRDLRRPQFPMVTDAASCWQTGRPSGNHSRTLGQVVGYEDGRVDIVKDKDALGKIYRNDNDEVAAGLNEDDYVLAGSSCRPVSEYVVLIPRVDEGTRRIVFMLSPNPSPATPPKSHLWEADAWRSLDLNPAQFIDDSSDIGLNGRLGLDGSARLFQNR
jgi:hypothetical protein